MDEIERNQWVSTVVDKVLSAIVSDEGLREVLIFKGARVLNMHLGHERQSLDVDSNFTAEFVEGRPDLDARRSWAEEHLGRAVRKNFENQNPVRFSLESIKVQRDPNSDPHPHGWDGLKATIRVTDQKKTGVRGLPAIEMDIASPESLGEGAVMSLSIDGHTMRVYTLERIAGEKLRAFLTSLPAYRRKIQSSVRAVRVKDLHDEARILRRSPIDNEAFWKKAAAEFILACKSRYVDCSGLETFQESWDVTTKAYKNDATLESVPFPEVEDALLKIVMLFERFGVFPLRFPLPA